MTGIYIYLDGGCCATKRRIDLMKRIKDTMLCIEIDEGGHKSYIQIDEAHAYNDLFMHVSDNRMLIR